MAKKWLTIAVIVAVGAGISTGYLWGRGGITRTETLTIYHAGSLSIPFADLEAEFESTHPNVDVLCELGGSAKMIRQVTELGKQADIVASADYTLIPSMMYNDYANWYIAFARNEMVLCYRDSAPFAAEIKNGTKTWYEVLRSSNVSYGHSNPDSDPCGYRALMVIQLAEKYYHDEAANFGLTPDPNADGLYDALIHIETPGDETTRGRVNIGKEVVRSKSVELIHLLESGDLDYAFEYLSVAVQHELDFIELDDAINLSQTGAFDGTTYEDFYHKASVVLYTSPTEIQTLHGQPIVYGITIPENAPNPQLAWEFIQLLLSETGQTVMTNRGLPPIIPATCDHPELLPVTVTQE